jgi:hypothetical protein
MAKPLLMVMAEMVMIAVNMSVCVWWLGWLVLPFCLHDVKAWTFGMWLMKVFFN